MRFIHQVIEFLVRQSHKEYSRGVRAGATVLGALLFIAGIPAFVIWAGTRFNTGLMMPASFAHLISLVCFIIGIPWVVSSVVWQLMRGRGTPIPIVPTTEFLESGPYRYIRNPMMLGFFCYLLGWAFLVDRWPVVGMAAVVIACLLMYMKFIEEHELDERFGTAYQEYKKGTPFIFPRLFKR